MKKVSFVLYAVAIVTVFIPITIVMITGNGFNAYYSHLFLNIATLLVIEGLILALARKAKEEGVVSWAVLGAINGLLLMLLWNTISK